MSDISPLISDLAFILIIAGFVTILFRWIKQPVILGYIVAGIMAGPHVSFLPTVSDPANIKIWGDIGIIFLLFSMGLGFSFRKLMNVGITALVTTVVIVCGMMFLGYTAGNAMGFSHAFEAFKEHGIFDKNTADLFRHNVLEKGDSEDPMVLYKNFRGAEPSLEPLLKNRGMK